eukprot:CAMPEP_0173118886 /NCGR_PEP_ID=MMETSP1102-20130122/51401_1 /TAXON_ID=49646 /ORGANISM="Geminigera sp., Strain Caron Lab Isolate" /LENGTH=118 /DNA_ID=CAMNT_0014024275 /DNA_START=264 /DNA_END=621 /DNA_ORIENTATION=-
MEMGASEAHCSAPLDVRWSLACFPALEHDALDEPHRVRARHTAGCSRKDIPEILREQDLPIQCRHRRTRGSAGLTWRHSAAPARSTMRRLCPTTLRAAFQSRQAPSLASTQRRPLVQK